jgi:hypothetical protein
MFLMASQSRLMVASLPVARPSFYKGSLISPSEFKYCLYFEWCSLCCQPHSGDYSAIWLKKDAGVFIDIKR